MYCNVLIIHLAVGHWQAVHLQGQNTLVDAPTGGLPSHNLLSGSEASFVLLPATHAATARGDSWTVVPR